MENTLKDVCLANISREQLPLLAELRCVPGVRVTFQGDQVWVRWDTADAGVVRVLLPVPGVRLYARRRDGWRVAGCELPAFAVPNDLAGQALADVLLPLPVEPVPPTSNLRPVVLRLAPDHQPREATACLCTPAELQHWADRVSVHRLAALEAACCEGRILLVGTPVPLFRAGLRFWGKRILVPLGCRPDPLLPEQNLAEAADLATGELVLCFEDRAEVIASEVLQPLTRAQVRLLESHHEARA